MHFSNRHSGSYHITIAESELKSGIVENSIEFSLDEVIFGRYISTNFTSKMILKSSSSEMYLFLPDTFGFLRSFQCSEILNRYMVTDPSQSHLQGKKTLTWCLVAGWGWTTTLQRWLHLCQGHPTPAKENGGRLSPTCLRTQWHNWPL